jgi:energy-coupling factor transporter ATP-binding protein EcfA2
LILLADEPTGNLDPGTSVGIMRILDRINRTGTTVVMATHDHAIVDAMRRRVVEIDRGRIMRDESRGIYETAQASTVPVTTEVQTVVEEYEGLDEPFDDAQDFSTEYDASEPNPFREEADSPDAGDPALGDPETDGGEEE